MAKRRANGEGSVFQRKDSRWCAKVLVNGELRSFYGHSQQEVGDKLLTARNANRSGAPLPREVQKVGPFLTEWLAAVKATVRPSTHKSYSEIVTLHLEPELGKSILAKLTPQQVQAMLARKSATPGLSPRRVQYIRAVLRMALGRALKFGLVVRNVATLTDVPRQIRHEIQPLGLEDARKLITAADDDRLGPLYVLAITTGLRQGECLGLTWGCVDLDGATVRVMRSLVRYDGAFHLDEPKTERSRRTLTLPKAAAAALRVQRARQNAERLRMGQHWQDKLGLVFTTDSGAPYHAPSAAAQFGRFLERHGLPDVRFHDLRHSAASLLLAQGVPLRSIMEQLGHSQISLTANLYTHIAPAMLQDNANKMDAALGS